MNVLRLIRYGAWALVAVVAIAAAMFVLLPMTPRTDAVTVGGPFALIDQNGATVTEATLKGHPSLMFFGYTFCPDVCPTTLFEATSWMKELGPDADRLKMYFVTVDPERDTRDVMTQYLSAFDPRIVGLTGSRAAVDKMLSAFRIYSRKIAGEDGASYTMDHSASIYMLDASGRFVGTIAYQEPQDEVLPKIRKLIAGS